MKIGKSIKIILDATKLERKQLAARLGIGRVYLCTLETGKVSGGEQMLKRISKGFNIPAIYIVTASDQNFKRQFPGTYRKIKRRMEALAAKSVTPLEKVQAA
jgi:transcriptional regulator with XRE-family HTH domain